MKCIVIIPARLESSRLPNKVLLDLDGKTIIQRVYEQCQKAELIDAVYIATDNKKVEQECKKFTDNIIMTSKEHASGTSRISEAAKDISCQAVVNVQGDEPFISPELIDSLAHTILNTSSSMCSAMQKLSKVTDLLDPNVVKVITNKNAQAIYFSRSPIPYPRDQYKQITIHDTLPQDIDFFKHIGIYGYKKDFLLHYDSLPPSKLESTEMLEQLRVLDAGENIQMITTEDVGVGIDTPQDYENALKLIKEIS